MTTYRDEFPNFPDADWPGFPHPSFTDASWHNDSQPSMASEELGLHIWVDRADPAERECGGTRFGVTETGADGSLADQSLLETDEWSQVCALVSGRAAGRQAKARREPKIKYIHAYTLKSGDDYTDHWSVYFDWAEAKVNHDAIVADEACFASSLCVPVDSASTDYETFPYHEALAAISDVALIPFGGEGWSEAFARLQELALKIDA